MGFDCQADRINMTIQKQAGPTHTKATILLLIPLWVCGVKETLDFCLLNYGLVVVLYLNERVSMHIRTPILVTRHLDVNVREKHRK